MVNAIQARATNKVIEQTVPAPDEQSKSAFWLDAYHDVVAGVRALSSCVQTCDLSGDGDWRLVIAGLDKKLKVWKGVQLASEQALQDIPCAIVTYYSDTQSPAIPALAIAIGSNVFIYRNLRPYYKFALPKEVPHEEEKTIWQLVHAGSMNSTTAVEALLKLHKNGVRLTQCAQDIIDMQYQDQAAEMQLVCQQFKGEAPVQQSTVTCMTAMKKAHDEDDAVSCLVIGTESCQLLVLEPTGTQILHTWQLKHVPAFLCITGLLDVEHRMAVATRDGKVMLMRNGAVQNTINLEALAVGLVYSNKECVVGCINQTVQSYNLKGRRTFAISLPAPILAMHALTPPQQKVTKNLLVSLANGELRVYNGQHLMSTTHLSSPYNAITFGKYGREDSTLIGITKSGALEVKILPRTAKLDGIAVKSGPPPEQDIPLDIPKRTALYVEQTEREKANAVDMHITFQQELVKLRLNTAKAYYKVLTDGQGATSTATASSASISFGASVSGLGPMFKISLQLQNTGSTPLHKLSLVLLYNRRIYSIKQNQIHLPVLLPSLAYLFAVQVLCLDPEAGSDSIKFLLHSASPVPILSALVKMPLSEMEEV